MLGWVDYAFCGFGRSAFGFIAKNFKTIFMVHFNIWLMHFSFYGGHIFRAVTNEEVVVVI